jgi:hypothetical protein
MLRCPSLFSTLVLALTIGACAHRASPPPPPSSPPPSSPPPSSPPPSSSPGVDVGGPLRVVFQPDSVEINGTLSRDVLMSRLDANAQEFASCVPRPAAISNPQRRLAVALRLTIGPDGKVTNAVLHDSDSNDRAIDNCIVHHAETMHFADAATRGPSVATFRMVIAPD